MEHLNTLKEHVEIMLPENGLALKLARAEQEQRKLIIKLGFDPTAPDLHLGHAVVLRKLKQFQDLGHQIVIVVGSFTAGIGDPTGKNKSRKPLSRDEVLRNAATYTRQLAKVIDVEKAKIVFNADWLDGMTLADTVRLLSGVTVAQLLQRNDFSKRFSENTPIALHELLYPVLQGFDSVQIRADIEIGGTDQLFNCNTGRQLQETFGMEAQAVLCMPLLRGLDGKEKMSKSLHNTIGLTDTPADMFGKTMSVPDHMLPDFLDLATDFSGEEREAFKAQLQAGVHPMPVKKMIAANIVRQYHGEASALSAEQFFSSQFQSKNFEEKVFSPVLVASLSAADGSLTLTDLCHQLKGEWSRSDIRRLITGGGVQVNQEKIIHPLQLIPLAPQTRIRVGKRDFFELT